MIYLIKTAVFIEGNERVKSEDSAVLALKIGYSRDERGNNRFNDYLNSGLSLKILKTIPGGSYRLENKLHHYFKKYNIPSKSREWFYFSDKIVEVFDRCEKESDLYNLFGVSSEEELSFKEYDSHSDRYKFNAELTDNINKFRLAFGESRPKILKLLEEILNTKLFQDRLKLVCNCGFVGDELNIFLSYLPRFIQNYYNVLGPDRIKELSYRNDMLKTEFDKIKNNQSIDISGDFLQTFIVGERYSLPEIKQTLEKIYTEHNYKRTPKAVDLKEVFEVKSCSIFKTLEDGTKQKLNGFEILSIKSSETDKN